MLLALLALLTAGFYAELVTKYPKAGGAAIVAERACKQPAVWFLVGFAMLADWLWPLRGLTFMSRRLTFGMAEQRLLPTFLTRLLPNCRTPWVAIVVTTLASMVLAVIGNLQALAETVVLLLLMVFVITNVAVLVLRKDKVAHRHFQVWSIVSVLGIASCILLLTQQKAQVWMFGAGFMVVGLVLYMLAQWATRRRAALANFSTSA